MFREAHQRPYGVVTLDGGDFVPAPGDSHRAEIATFLLESMPLMELDAIGVGELDLLLGPTYLREAARRMPLIGANVRFGPGLAESLPPLRWVDAKGQRVAVIAYVDPLLYYETPGAFDMADSLMVGDARSALEPVVAEARRTADVVVLLAHARLDNISELLSRLEGVDIVVQGHDPPGPRAESRIGDAYLVLPGPRGREVALFTLVWGIDGSVERARLQNYRLAALTEGDPALQTLVEEFKARQGIP